MIIKCWAWDLVWRMCSLKMLSPSFKFHALGITPAVYSKFFLEQLTWKRNGPCLPHLRSEYVEDAGFWDKRVGCSLSQRLWPIPSSWLPGGSIVPCLLSSSFLCGSWDRQTHLLGCRNRARLCVHCLILSRLGAVLAWAPEFTFPEDAVCLLALTALGGNGSLCWDNALSKRPGDFLPILFIHQASALKKAYF